MRDISSLSDLEKHKTIACCLKFVANPRINTPGTLTEAESCKTGKSLLANRALHDVSHVVSMPSTSVQVLKT